MLGQSLMPIVRKPKREPSCTLANFPVSNIKCVDVITTEIIKELRSPWSLPDIPVCVVPYGDKFIIADGNHRFKADLQMNKDLTKAWILKDCNKKNIDSSEKFGMSQWLKRWKEGIITYRELIGELVKRAEEIGTLKG